MATITDEGRSITIEANGRRYNISKTHVKPVQLGTDEVAIYDTQSRQRDVQRIILDYTDVTDPKVSSGNQLFDKIVKLKDSNTSEQDDLELIRKQTSELNQIKERLKETNKWLEKIYSPI